MEGEEHDDPLLGRVVQRREAEVGDEVTIAEDEAQTRTQFGDEARALARRDDLGRVDAPDGERGDDVEGAVGEHGERRREQLNEKAAQAGAADLSGGG